MPTSTGRTGSTLGKAFDGQHLLILFAILMLVVGALMLRNRDNLGRRPVPAPKCPQGHRRWQRDGAIFSGFFGIGGGFLTVLGLMASTGMPMINAVGSSLVAVTAFGLTTALNYAFAGLIDWGLAAPFIGGGIEAAVDPQSPPEPFIRGTHLLRRPLYLLEKLVHPLMPVVGVQCKSRNRVDRSIPAQWPDQAIMFLGRVDEFDQA
ncbi:membrane protein [Sphingobium indicum BiD32]|uniref:Probable membrane transporter protein n=1 Tax=Sphingobium indicum BiD32 TaxID=1301087 RepID=N1MQS8_9SPHN|nr:sulfite exporter TauE/SafE family protein [Sphingobium indicum]CCW19286.1 membrane protein [Sphingobium indicum BiD32]